MKMDDIFKHPRGASAVLFARLLLMDIPKSKTMGINSFFHQVGGIDHRASRWHAYSPYIFCANCKTVYKVGVPVETTVITSCGNCRDKRPFRFYESLFDNVARWLDSIEPEVQPLVLEYLYLRQELSNDNTTT